jgi:hypothetical protein
MYVPKLAVKTTYRGFPVVVDHRDIYVEAPDGDLAYFPTMSGVRLWVKRKRKSLGMPGNG